MPKITTLVDLTTADDAITTALAAVGDCLFAKLRDNLIYASDWCWMQRVDVESARAENEDIESFLGRRKAIRENLTAAN